jgi:2-polyprenyl-3-methyl-5-hydroxy-6-metoxy-1,4-benzoquinol methylase
VLDFGCGAGRVLRHFTRHEDCELHGCDIDEASIAWAEKHLSPPLHVFVDDELPPLPYADGWFDLIYAASVFTHLSDSWSAWLAELHRLLKPDGVLIATFLGPPMYAALIGQPWDEERTGMNVFGHFAPWSEGGPMVFHSRWWLEGHWGRAFEITKLETEGFGIDPTSSGQGHGYVVMRPRAGSFTAEQLERIDPEDPRELAALRHNARLLARRERETLMTLMHTRAQAEAQPPDPKPPAPRAERENGRRVRPRFRYDYDIDPKADSSHTRVADLVGSGKRVLELGCATGYMSRLMVENGCRVVGVDIDAAAAERAREFCERVIVADLNAGELARELAGEHFDVVIAADVLEHLVTPDAVLREVVPLLGDEGYFVASIPNVTHGSVRLALLQGRFEYTPLGLLDETHLRFFSRKGIFDLFEKAGYAVFEIGEIIQELESSEVRFDPADVPPEVRDQIEDDPDSRVYQFIVVARPLPAGVPPSTLGRFHAVSDELRSTRLELGAASAELERVRGELLHANARDSELRELFYSAQTLLAERDADLLEKDRRLVEFDRVLAERDERERAAVEQLARLEAERDHALEVFAATNAQLESMRNTRAWRIAALYWRLKKLGGSLR